MNKPSVLIIDDEASIRKLLRIQLEQQEYRVKEAASGKEGIFEARQHPPDLIVLDLGLPDISGQFVLTEIRTWYANPIIIVSAMDHEEAIVNALDAGATDYLTKPFRNAEFAARIRVALRSQHRQSQGATFRFGPYELDFDGRILRKSGHILKLTQTEFHLLSFLVRNEGRVLTHAAILREVWGPGYFDQTQYLRVFIGTLRKKIELNPNQPEYLITESGVGYRFQSNA